MRDPISASMSSTGLCCAMLLAILASSTACGRSMLGETRTNDAGGGPCGDAIWSAASSAHMCLPTSPLLPPLALQDGRIRLLLPDLPPGLTWSARGRGVPVFYVVDVTETGQELVTAGDCEPVAAAIDGRGVFQVACGIRNSGARGRTLHIDVRRLDGSQLIATGLSATLKAGADAASVVLLPGDDSCVLVYRERVENEKGTELGETLLQNCGRGEPHAIPTEVGVLGDSATMGPPDVYFRLDGGRVHAVAHQSESRLPNDYRGLDLTGAAPRWLGVLDRGRLDSSCDPPPFAITVQAGKRLRVQMPVPSDDFEPTMAETWMDATALPGPTIVADDALTCGAGNEIDLSDMVDLDTFRMSCGESVCIVAYVRHRNDRTRRLEVKRLRSPVKIAWGGW